MRLQFFPRLESNRLTGRDRHLFPRPGISSYATFTGLNDEHAKASELDSLTSRERFLHRVEERINRLFRLHLGNTGLLSYPVDDVQFDHFSLRLLQEGSYCPD